MYKLLGVLSLCILFLPACSDPSTDYVKEETETPITEPEESSMEEEPLEEVVEEESLVEPLGAMEDWVSYTPDEKIGKVEECIEYVSKWKEENRTPITITGTPAEFVEVLDARYEEIQGLTGEKGFEKWRMNQASIASQVDIMGASSHLYRFSY